MKLFKLFDKAIIEASKEGHTEIVELIREKERKDTNSRKVYLFCLMFQNKIYMVIIISIIIMVIIISIITRIARKNYQ